MASPAKLQAAAALAEVANGIEGEVSPRSITESLACPVRLKKKKNGKSLIDCVLFCVCTETSPSANPSEACCKEREPVV